MAEENTTHDYATITNHDDMSVMRVLLHTQGIVSQVEAWRSKMKCVKFGLAENTKAEISAPRTNVMLSECLFQRHERH
jgi:hypothetical protein